MIIHILMLLGAVGLFLFGMKTMSEAVQKLSGNRLRSILSAMASSPLRGIAAGGAITALVQSSSATTVMIVSFVNAGLLHLTQAIGMVMGANIGTTVTTWLVALFGFNFDINMAAVPVIAVGFPLLLLRNERVRNVGSGLIGLALMLLAIQILRETVTHLADTTHLETYIQLLNGHGTFTPLLFVVAGMLLTAAVQSSSVTTTLAIVMGGAGLVPFECALALILGDNIGTTVTANLAATMTGTDGKRTALAHLLFNLTGALWALPLLGPISAVIATMVVAFGGESPLLATQSQAIALALFHTLFNVVNTLLLVALIPLLAELTRRIIPARTPKKNPPYILGGSLISASEITLFQSGKELADCVKRGGEIAARVRDYFGEINTQSAQDLFRVIEQRAADEQEAYRVFEHQLTEIAQQEVSRDARRFIQQLLRVVTQMRAATWLSTTAARIIFRKKERNIWFSQAMREDLGIFFSIIQEAYFLIYNNLMETSEEPSKHEERRARMQSFLNEFSTSLETKYLNPEQEQEIHHQAGMIFIELTSCIKRLATCVLEISADTTELARSGDK